MSRLPRAILEDLVPVVEREIRRRERLLEALRPRVEGHRQRLRRDPPDLSKQDGLRREWALRRHEDSLRRAEERVARMREALSRIRGVNEGPRGGGAQLALGVEYDGWR